MSKFSLREDQMSDASFVDDAAYWAKHLTLRESRGPGDTGNAMRRLESRYGVPYSALWSLRYRRPKDIVTSVYMRLRAAYEAECERQMRLLQIELEITRAKAGPLSSAVVAAEALVGETLNSNNRG